MNTFVDSLVKANKPALRTKTENGAVTFSTSKNKNVDLFFKIGAMRGQPTDKIISAFKEAFDENSELAVRILLWARDIREGAGERNIFREIFNYLELTNRPLFERIAVMVPEIGRWDDLLVAKSEGGKQFVFKMIKKALADGNQLVAKWMPRKGPIAVELTKFLGLTPKQYRKTLVNLTNVVETPMCKNEFNIIDYQKVPSVAMSRYTKAFTKNDEARFNQFLADVTTGEAKINAGAVYPYDVLKGARDSYMGRESRQRMIVQWDALPNFMGDDSILPMIDVSGSMASNCGGSLTCMDVATSLGLYLSTKNTGEFKDVVLTFTSSPYLHTLKGDIVDKYQSLFQNVGYSTNLEAAFKTVLSHAVQNKVAQSEMPKYILILSDMEFDSFGPNETASKNIKNQYDAAGYSKPILVWWNIQSRNNNSPVKFDKKGNVLVSGFSPAIAKSIMAMDPEKIDPLQMMLSIVMKERYDF